MFTRFLGIAGNSLTETIRQPIYGILLLVTAFLLVLNLSLAGYTFDDDNKLLKDLSLSTLLLCGLFLAAFSAAGVLSREIENKTVLTVVSKPVGRPVFCKCQHDSHYGPLPPRASIAKSPQRVVYHRRSATSAQIASTTPNGQAPLRKP